MLVQTPNGVGIVIKTGKREVACAIEGMSWDHVVLVLINDEPKWYNVNKVQELNRGNS